MGTSQVSRDLPGESSWSCRLREAVLEVIAPTRCAGCERPGALICDECLAHMTPIDPVHSCLRCGAPFGDVLCTECATDGGGECIDAVEGDDAGDTAAPQAASRTEVGRCLAATVFEGPVPRIIRAYKDAGERRLGQLLAELMLDAAEHAEAVAPHRYNGLISDADAVTFVPVTSTAFRRRGFDHMECVASSFAQMAGVPLLDALVKYGSSDQRALGRAEREAHARGVYEVVEPVAGKRLLLLDDVITTGATIRAARSALLAAGARRVDALAFARVW